MGEQNKKLDIVYLTITPCKIEDLHKCVQNLRVEAIDFEVTNDDIKTWRKLFTEYQKPILKQKNFVEVGGMKLDLKKESAEQFGVVSNENMAKVLLEYRGQECGKIFEYTFFDGENLILETAKSPLKISDSIHYPIEKPIESVMEILVNGNWVRWYEASELDRSNWYLEQRLSLNKILQYFS
jgi:hypothetical protein